MSNTQNWPGELPGDNPASPWVNKLRAAAMAASLADVKFPGGQAKLIPGPQGQTLVLSANPAPNPEVFFPFKIYNIGNAADPTKSNLTIQIRSGIIAARGAFVLPSVGFDSQGNFEQYVPCGLDNSNQFDDQPTPLTGGNITLDNAADTLIYDDNWTSGQNTKQIVIDSTDDALGFENSTYWIKIVDDSTKGLTFQLWGRMYEQVGANPPVRQTDDFPAADPSIIPIGKIISFHGKILTIDQYIFGNVINRYAPAVAGSAVPCAGVMRGDWVLQSLSGKLFWPGDRMIGSTVLTSPGGVDMYGTWTYKGAVAIVSTEPTTSTDPNWILEGLTAVI